MANEVVEFNSSDGMIPIAVRKLNSNFNAILKILQEIEGHIRIADDQELGLVIAGNGLTIDDDGVMSVDLNLDDLDSEEF